ncbi:MAG: L,D-transpeptidase family protein [Planctomycetota bacterium]
MQRLRRKSRRRRNFAVVILILVGITTGGWWYFSGDDNNAVPPANTRNALVATGDTASMDIPVVVEVPEDHLRWSDDRTEQPEDQDNTADEVLEPEGPAQPIVTEQEPPIAEAAKSRTDNQALEAARRQYADGQVLEARQALNTLLQKSLSRIDQAEVRRLLTQMAEETIFTKRRLPNDPLVNSYTVRSGDYLINIGREYQVPPEILMRINGITDARKLRADQTIKVLRGPFHARIHKSEFRLDVYLQDLYIRSFRVGLGTDQGTPEGVWRVKERLSNPTYYPSPSAEVKRIIAADDPQNPLGEHWIGLEGIEGEALGRYGYGIHGTIEPESIGQAVSLGCVRMHNEDIALFYKLMLPQKSTITILP